MDQYFRQLRNFTHPAWSSGQPCPVVSVGWSIPERPARAVHPFRASPTSITHVGFGAVDAALLSRTGAELVVSPVTAPDFDCSDLVRRLCRMGYRGRYRAIAILPYDVGLIEAEMREICPHIDFAIVLPPEQLRAAG